MAQLKPRFCDSFRTCTNKQSLVQLLSRRAEEYERIAYLCVGKEERHCAQGADNHGIFPTKDLHVTHPASHHRALKASLATQ